MPNISKKKMEELKNNLKGMVDKFFIAGTTEIVVPEKVVKIKDGKATLIDTLTPKGAIRTVNKQKVIKVKEAKVKEPHIEEKGKKFKLGNTKLEIEKPKRVRKSRVEKPKIEKAKIERSISEPIIRPKRSLQTIKNKIGYDKIAEKVSGIKVPKMPSMRQVLMSQARNQIRAEQRRRKEKQNNETKETPKADLDDEYILMAINNKIQELTEDNEDNKNQDKLEKLFAEKERLEKKIAEKKSG